MESTYWVRIGAIFVLFFGSLWVLLPTVVRESAEDRFARQTDEIESPAQRDTSLVVVFTAEGDATALADALTRRMALAKVEVEKVAPNGNTVEVTLTPGASRTRAEVLGASTGEVALLPADAFGALTPATGPAPTDPLAPGSAEQLLNSAGLAPADAVAAVGQIRGQLATADTPRLPLNAAAILAAAQPILSVTLAEGQTWPTDARYAILAVDGRAVGIVTPSGAGALLDADADVAAVLASGPLPGKLTAVAVPAEVAAVAKPAEAMANTSFLPDWLVAWLPNTAIPLGLDLQGGIDLTLQVELEEAVLGQVSRDAVSLKEAAGREGIAIESIRRNHSLPVIEIATDAPLADLQAYVQKRTQSEYVYKDSEGRLHRFELSEPRQEQIKDQAVEQVLDTLRKRVDATGVKDPSIVRKSGGRINIQLPGMEDIQAAVDAIGTTAVLEFRMVDEDFNDAYLDQILAAAKKAMPPEQFADDELLNEWLWDTKQLDLDKIVLWEYATGPDGKDARARALPLFNEVVLTGNDVNDAGVEYDQNQQANVRLDFKPRGGQIFCEVTGQAVGKRFGIILDGMLKSAPSIREQICGGSARIEMGGAEDPMQEARTLALVLRTGALDAPVVVASKSQVGATLGADAIREGTTAAVVGSILVYAFMLLWYRTSGLIADIALTINVMLVLASLGVLGATLTLPGIAGIALTVGMAVDSNIIVYERIREELRLGVHPRKAVDVGFEKALVAVVDANVTTAIAAIVLYSYGTGPVKGFAVTLGWGIITTLVTAFFVTRTIMEALTRSSAARLQI